MSQTELNQTESITLIGAGLVGSLMSISLGQRGYKVDVYDKLPDIRKTSIPAGRSINLALANRGIRALQQVGIMEKAQKLLIPMTGRLIHDIEGNLNLQPYGQKPDEVIHSVPRAGLVSVVTRLMYTISYQTFEKPVFLRVARLT